MSDYSFICQHFREHLRYTEAQSMYLEGKGMRAFTHFLSAWRYARTHGGTVVRTGGHFDAYPWSVVPADKKN